MKQLIVPIAIIVALIAFFVIIDRKEFSRHDDVQTVQRESSTTNRKSTVSVSETKPATEVKPAVETKPVAKTKPVTEAKPVTDPKLATEARPVAETKTVVETKPAEEKLKPSPWQETKTDKPTETKPVAQTKLEEKLLPAAVPVVTAEEAEKLNKAALDFSKEIEEKKMKAEKKKNSYFKKARLIHSADFQILRPIGANMLDSSDSLVVGKGYDLSEFRKRLIPYSWRNMDFDTLPQEASFGKDNDGFHIISPKGRIRFHGYYILFESMNSSFFFEVVVRNNSSTSDCKVDLGIQGEGSEYSGYMTINSDYIPAAETTTLKWDATPLNQLYLLRPTISIWGDATIKEFRIYQYVHPEITVIEGTIKDRSQLPDPSTTDYPDCSYTAHFVGNAILEGPPCNKDVELTIDGFINKTLQRSNGLKKGDNLKCAIIKFDQLPEIKSSGTQVADDLSLFELDSYYLLYFQKISAFSDPGENNTETIEFLDSKQTKKKYISIYENIFNTEMDESAKLAQKESIANDLERITEMLEPYTPKIKQELNNRFQDAWTKEKQKDSQGYNRIKNIVWRNMDNAFYALPEQYTFIEEKPDPISQANIDALVAFKEYLELQGIQFIISLVPHYYAIAARVINKDFTTVPDFGTAYVAKQLLENGIETIYASDEIIRNYNKYPFPYVYPNDGHPADLLQDILSSLVAERVSRLHFRRTLDAKDFSVDFGDNGLGSYGSMAYPPNCDIGNNPVGGHYQYTKVLYQGKKLVNNQNSPIILLGNSYSYSPTDQAMMSFLAMKTGIEIYQISIGYLGPFTTAIQRIFNNPEHYLKGKKVVILQMGTDHFLSNASILNIKRLDDSMQKIRNGHLIKTISLSSNGLMVPEFARKLTNPFVFKIGPEKKATIFETDNLLEYLELDSLSSGERYYIEINYCCEETDMLSLAVNSSLYHLNGGNYIYLWMKEVLPLSLESNDLKIEVHGLPGKYIAIGSIRIYQMAE